MIRDLASILGAWQKNQNSRHESVRRIWVAVADRASNNNIDWSS
jgi:hypothetical protein